MISLRTFFWLAHSENTGHQCHQPSSSSQSGVYMLVGSTQLTSPTWQGVFSIWKTAQRYCSVYPLRGNQDLAPRLVHVSASPLFPNEHLFEPALWNSWKVMGSWMKTISYNSAVEDTERLLCPGAPKGPARFYIWDLGIWCDLEKESLQM